MKIILSSLLTSTDLCRIFDRSQQSIYLWRKKHELPCIVIRGHKKDSIRYEWKRVEAWAKKANRVIVNQPNLGEMGECSNE